MVPYGVCDDGLVWQLKRAFVIYVGACLDAYVLFEMWGFYGI